jgi:hypothetical protein
MYCDKLMEKNEVGNFCCVLFSCCIDTEGKGSGGNLFYNYYSLLLVCFVLELEVETMGALTSKNVSFLLRFGC